MNDTIQLKGRIFVVGDDVNTDEIIPARYCVTTNLDSLGEHALEDLHEEKNPFGVPYRCGQYNILIAGENFGCGSSREVAPIALQKSGIHFVFAKSFARIFYRNAINIGLPISTNLALIPPARTDDEWCLDLKSADLWSHLPSLHRQILLAGGLTNFNRSNQSIDQLSAAPRPMTIAEKILAKAANVQFVAPGASMMAEVDRVVTHELAFPVAVEQLRQHYGDQSNVANPDKILLAVDHTIQIPLVRDYPASQQMIEKSARYAAQLELPNAFLPPAPYTSQGICHVLLPEKGLIKPDTLVVGTDSHTCTYGAYGAFAVGIGNTDLTEVMAWGRLLIDVPETIRVQLDGVPPDGVYAKDIILHILSQVTMNGFTNCAIEFSGSTLPHLSEEDRSTIANMTVEGGAICGIFPVGQLQADEKACYKATLQFDISTLSPIVAPPFKPDNGIPIEDVDQVPITVAWIGSCTGGKFEDIVAAAHVVRGRRVAPGVRFIVSPATIEIMAKAGRLGYLRDLVAAGAMIAQPACGACIGMGPGATRKDDVGVFASNRNFKGRTGDGAVYLASPATVAASAIHGFIADARVMLSEVN